MPDSDEPVYFYMAGGGRHGPFPFEALIKQPVHRQTPVWRKGMADWQPANEVSELADRLPPPPPAMATAVVPAASRSNAAVASTMAKNAVALRELNVGLLCLIGGTLFLSMLSGSAFGVVYLIAAVAWVVLLYRAAAAVPVNLPWVWAIGGVLPLVGYVPLILLHNRLKRPLEAAGYRISFLGQATPPVGGEA